MRGRAFIARLGENRVFDPFVPTASEAEKAHIRPRLRNAQEVGRSCKHSDSETLTFTL